MQHQAKIEDSGLAPSFSCYSTDSATSKAVTKAIREEQEARFNENGDIEEGGDFEFSLSLSDEEVAANETDSRSWTVFKRDLLPLKDDEIDTSSTITEPLGKLFIGERDESSSYSSSEADELENPPSGRTYCVWSPKENGGSSPLIGKGKKSSSTGSGSKRWLFRYLLRRTNSCGKQPTMLLNPKKVDSPKSKRNSGERWKAETLVHEQFYVQRRAEKEDGKRKSYLPYRKDLLGLFGNVNGFHSKINFV